MINFKQQRKGLFKPDNLAAIMASMGPSKLSRCNHCRHPQNHENQVVNPTVDIAESFGWLKRPHLLDVANRLEEGEEGKEGGEEGWEEGWGRVGGHEISCRW